MSSEPSEAPGDAEKAFETWWKGGPNPGGWDGVPANVTNTRVLYFWIYRAGFAASAAERERLEKDRDEIKSAANTLLERKLVSDLFCTSMETWRSAIEREHGDDPEWRERISAIRTTFLMIKKSSLLARLIYGDERLRTEKCPEHNGKWSGLPSRPEHDCCGLTGWREEPER